MAAVSDRRAAFNNLGVKDNDIVAYSAPATPRLEAITANNTAPYIATFMEFLSVTISTILPSDFLALTVLPGNNI